MNIHQQPHQFCNRDTWVSIVQLEAVFLGKFREISAMTTNPVSNHVLQTSRSQQILLL